MNARQAVQERVLRYVQKAGGGSADTVRRGTGVKSAAAVLNALVKAGKLRVGSYGGWKVQWDRLHELKNAKTWVGADRSDPSTKCARFTMYWPLAEAM